MDRKNKLIKLIKYHKNILKNHRYQPGLAGADLRFMDLRGLYLRNINLSGCDISFCDLRGADFSCANLAGANLSYCKTEGTIFSHADCTCVDFTGSDIHDVRLLTEYEQNESDTPLSRPLISIYMPTWNRQALTIRAIQSVLNQDYVNWELIIIDDFSSSFDQLLTYISELNDSRITYIRNEFNSGACAVRNQAIRMARGDLITGLDDDDEWLPTRLSSFLTWQHKLQLHSFLYANDYLCDGTGYHHPDELQVYPK
ncbi:TPA: glycosyltransferase, partial [Enterobacter roggenkampii]